MSSPEQVREIALAYRMRHGDTEAFEEFCRSFGRRLFHYSLLICGQREDAEEVVQDTLLRLQERIQELREPERVRPWAFRIARNICLMKRRSPSCAASRASVPLEDTTEATFVAPALEAGASIGELYGAIARLPEDQLIVFLLRGVEGLTTLETAEVLGLSEEAVKGRLKRARQTLQSRLAGPV